MKRTIFGVAWFRREQWARLVEICADREALDASYDDWLQSATARFAELTAAGYSLKRVDVDVERLLAWCAVRGRPVDAAACSEYAAAMLAEERKRQG
jgi:hypothetical protein